MKKLLLFLTLFCLAWPAAAQHTVRGTVVSVTDNTPLPGATVRVKDTAMAVRTDEEGAFELPVPEGAMLVVSYLGFMPQEVPLQLPLNRPLRIALAEDSQHLQEVEISTGYQRLPRERATGSFSYVDAQTLQEQAGTDVLSRLEAVASGVTVDQSTGLTGRLMIRGLSTIQGPREPLIVVDNFPYEGDIANINPNDVESITILKDAAAASIWGTRAGNGVVVITTKKGRYNQPLSADLTANLTLTGKPNLDYLQFMAASDFIDVELFLYEKGYYASKLRPTSRTVVSPVVELLDRRDKGQLTAAEAEAQLNALRQVDIRDEYARRFYQRGTRQQYALQLKSGSEVLAWNLSAGYDRNLDPLAAGYNRLNLRLHNSLRPTRQLTLTTSALYTESRSTGGRPSFGTTGKSGKYVLPYTRLADAAGNPLSVVNDYRQAYLDTVGGGKLLDWNYYPLTDDRHTKRSSGVQDLTANLGLTYALPQGLSADLRYQYERQQTNGELLYGKDSYFARNLINTFSQLDPSTGSLTRPIPTGGIQDFASILLTSHNVRGQLNFDKAWGGHSLTAMAGGELRHARNTDFRQRRFGFDPDILTFGQVDLTTPYPNLITNRAAYIPDNSGVSEGLSRFASHYANAAYTYRQRYTLSASARRDASNLFGLRTNDLWNPLWSVGLSWELSGENFYTLAFLPYLKLRSTYGYSGNTNPAMTAVTTMDYVFTSPYTQSPYARFSTYANSELRWETVGMWNLGLDFASKGDRLRGSLEYYQKRGHDLFGTAPMDYTAGVGEQVIKNVAAMRGRGLDLVLRTRNLAGAFSWTTDLNASHYRDEISDYFLSSRQGSRFVTSNLRVSGITGKPVYAVYSYRWAGLDPATGDPRGYVDGEPSSDYTALTGPETQVEDLAYHGSALPTFFGSLGNTFSWKGFSLTARLSWKLGYYFRATSLNYSTLFSNWGGHADFAKRWQQPGDEAHTQVPSLVYPNNSRRDTFYSGSEVLVEKGDHVRVQYLNLAYQLPARPQGRLKSLQLQLNLSNPGLLWRANDRGLDPDAYGLNALPTPPALSLGLKASL
ncbi:SusC/RagA family TonB-linked outer membrane protein [Pontibacter mangrovi]|uniref:SusC/RagA family TonB-linked outer membrane protein n=1 Tax=Pontibacter mangrovi TaxID=2589816 RepID=A0A501VXG3_9BACT|nr:SusC/RagA family TonB-linked outer membrane protein [Pontibacter mangrovi]TPE42413.1 SusC/RagA family TonB-linked outer membrane protein [Pontibacter mangrovi]